MNTKDVIIVFIVSFFLLMILISRNTDFFKIETPELDKKIESFLQDEVSGIITNYNADRGLVHITIKDISKKEYALWPKPQRKNRFYNTISVGDSLIKEKNSNMLTLKLKSGEIYFYEIRTFDNDD